MLVALILPRDGRVVDYSSYDRKFGNDDFRAVAPGETVTLVDHAGAGIVRRLWLTIAPRNNRDLQRQLIVRCYGMMRRRRVEVPVADFFGVGFGEWKQYAPLQLKWYFDTGPYSAPYHRLTIKDEASGRISAYRWHIEDAIPFQRSLRFTIEHGGTNDAPGTDYSPVAFWYQTHPHAAFPALPAVLLPTSPWMPVRPAELIEGEALLAVAKVSAGKTASAGMSEWGSDSSGWGGGEQLWWTGNQTSQTRH